MPSLHPLPVLAPLGMVYTPKRGERALLAAFARDLQRRGFQVAGIVQEFEEDAAGNKLRMVSIDLTTGDRLGLSLPPEQRAKGQACELDRGRLAEASAIIRRALAVRPDLIVIDKFGEQEAEGQGFQDEILACMAEGVPTLTAVSNHVLTNWQQVTGGLAQLAPADERALWRWWGPHRLYADLAQGLKESDARAKRVVIGHNWTLVEGPDGCGIAQSPGRTVAACRPVRMMDGGLTGRPLADLAQWIHSLDPVEVAIGLAAVNAFYNRYDLTGADINGLDAFADGDGEAVVVGRFPGLEARVGDHHLIERDGGTDAWPESASHAVISRAERLMVTASALVDHSLPGLLAACSGLCRTTVTGPGTPLTPRLHAYGMDVLAGLVITDADLAARIVSEGGAQKGLKQAGRMVTLAAD